MDQPSRTNEPYYDTHPGGLDPSHHFHPSSSHPYPHLYPHLHPTLRRPSHSGVHYDSPQHGMFQQSPQHHAGFPQQNESQHLREFSDFHESAISHHSYQQDRAHLSILPSNIPQAYGGSHPPGESQHSGGPQSGSLIDPHHHPHQDNFRASIVLPRHGTTHYERSDHLDQQQNRRQSQNAENISHHSNAPSQRQEGSHHQVDHPGGHQAHSHRGEHGSKSTTSRPRSILGARSHVFSQVHSKESLRESPSLSGEEDHVQKRKKAQRTHKKAHTGNIFQLLWGKISHLLLGLQQMILSLTQTLSFETFIFVVVCLNTVVLVAQTFTELEIRCEWYFMVLDSIFLSIYVLEAILKLIGMCLEYFYDPWNNLDFFIMVMAVLDFVLLQINSLSYSFYNHSLFRILKVFKSMRALRAIRVLRRLSILTSLHEVTGTLSGSLPSIIAILTLMFTCLFLFSVVLRALFHESDQKRFQNIFTTLFTLFTMLTLDDWSLIYIDNRAEGAWYIIPILMIYIIIQYFIFLNLVIAVLVDSFQMALIKGLEKVKLEQAARVHEKLLEDSLTDLNKADDAQMTEEALKMQLIEKMFGNMTVKQRALHFQFLQLVAAVEQHQQKFRSQASVIDELVDIAFEAGDEDYGK
ncbi:cation channel sperm-associated protein 1 isoform X4 [Mastomys coucha]|uniref:cation channel sperm-associated protein 1 isoform X4 n=1 Tax=Mastomys coucha TaxID=35658 RepID=UPI00126160FA|nr:cation channel sperm-associated protein 1 isoform X4 [Mastomys coucha]